MTRLCLASLLVVVGAACASDPAPKETTPDVTDERVPPTKYRVGDFVTYLYQGDGLAGDVLLHERITEQDGNVLHIEVEARRGDERKRWIQVVTDTPANQASNTVDALYLLHDDGTREALNVADPTVLYRLYGWTILEGLEPAGEPTKAAVVARVGAERVDCVETELPARVKGAAATLRTTTCPEFLWTHGPGLATGDGGRVLWKVSVIAAGRSSARQVWDVTGWEGFYPPAVVSSDVWLAHKSLPVTAETLARVHARTVKLVLAGGEQEAKEAELKERHAATCVDGEVRAWNEDRCRGLEERKCEDGRCTYEHFGNCSGFLAGGGRLVTAAHCVAELDAAARKASAALVPDGDGVRRLALGAVRAGKEDFAHDWVAVDDKDPVDVAVVAVDDGGLAAWDTAPVPRVGEVVFIHGYPRVEGRAEPARAKLGYDLNPGLPTYSFGKIADRNEIGQPLCNVDGRQEHWQLLTPCERGPVTVDGEQTWRGPISRRPFLGTWDTANGYSGAPVFDRQGRWVGVNATLMSPHSPQERYSSLMFQVATSAEVALERLGESR